MIKITVQGKDTKEVEFKARMRLGDAIKAAGITVMRETTFTVNGQSAKSRTKLNDKDEIVVIPPAGNG